MCPSERLAKFLAKLERDGVHFILFSREPFSEGQYVCALEVRSRYFHHLRVLVLSLASLLRYILCS